MLLGIHFSWTLVLIDVIIYTLLQLLRIWTDMVLPARCFDPERPYYQSWEWENDGKFYQQHFKINKWKDKLPSFNSLNHFSKKKLLSLSPDYLRQFIFETCRGESHHVRTVLETCIFIIWNPFELFWLIFILSFLVHMPFIVIQRFNRPRLKKILTYRESR